MASTDRYVITIKDLAGVEHTTKTQTNTDIEFAQLEAGVFYNLEIKTGRKVDIDGVDAYFYGDVFTQQIQSGKIPHCATELSNTSLELIPQSYLNHSLNLRVIPLRRNLFQPLYPQVRYNLTAETLS